jgi:electron transport complex protein RnfG
MNSIATAPWRTRLPYQAGLLGGVCCAASILLVAGNLSTSTTISHHMAQDELAMLAQVLPPAMYDNDPLQESRIHTDSRLFTGPVTIMTAKKNGEVSGIALRTSIPGWGGKIQLITGIAANGEITGVRVISHQETPGLADKIEIEKDPWITGFNGKSLANTAPEQWAVKKDKGTFDQFTGATITPRAMVKGVYHAVQFHQQWRNQQSQEATP